MTDFKTYQMNNRDKQPQTCYVKKYRAPNKNTDSIIISEWSDTESRWKDNYGEQLKSVYIHTPEEMEALLQKERREAAEKAWNDCLLSIEYNGFEEKGMDYYKQTYLDQHYPSPQPINTNQ